MENRPMYDSQTVYNKPFFVNELLRLVHPGTITIEMFAEMVEASRVFDRNTMLTAIARQIDCSGLTPNLIGTCKDPQEVLEVLMNMGHAQLQKIERLEPELQKEIYDTLKGDRDNTSLRALVVLDECQAEVTGVLAQARKQSPKALAVRAAMDHALHDLYKNPQHLDSPLFDQVISLADRKIIYRGEPHICYPKVTRDGAVVEVWQFFFMPKIGSIRLHRPEEEDSVGVILDELTPNVYRRAIADETKFNPRTPSGFMGLLGKVGGALPRLIANQVKKNEQIHARVMREEAILETLNELW